MLLSLVLVASSGELPVRVTARDSYLLVSGIPLRRGHGLAIKFSTVEKDAVPPYEFASGALVKMFVDGSHTPVRTAFLPNVYNAAKLTDAQVGFIHGRCFLALGALSIDNYWKAILSLDLRKYRLGHMLTVDRGNVDFRRGIVTEFVKDIDIYDQWPDHYRHVTGVIPLIAQTWTYDVKRRKFVGHGYVFPKK